MPEGRAKTQKAIARLKAGGRREQSPAHSPSPASSRGHGAERDERPASTPSMSEEEEDPVAADGGISPILLHDSQGGDTPAALAVARSKSAAGAARLSNACTLQRHEQPQSDAQPPMSQEVPDEAGRSGVHRRRFIIESDDQDARPVRLDDAFGADMTGAAQEPVVDGGDNTQPPSVDLQPILDDFVAADARNAEYEPYLGEARESLHPAQPAVHMRTPAKDAAMQLVACVAATTVDQEGQQFLSGGAQQMPGQQGQGRRRTEAERLLRLFDYDKCAAINWEVILVNHRCVSVQQHASCSRHHLDKSCCWLLQESRGASTK